MIDSLERVQKYGNVLNSHDVMKAMAIMLMIVDHVGAYLVPWEALRLIGRFSFPLFFFLIGYAYTAKIPRSLIIGGVILVLCDAVLSRDLLPLNILFTVILCRTMLQFFIEHELIQKNILVLMVMLVVWHLMIAIFFEYGALAMMFAICGYMVKHHKDFDDTMRLTAFLVSGVGYFMFQSISLSMGLLSMAVFAIGLVGLLQYLKHYQFQKKIYEPGLAGKVLLMVPVRYSLEVYVFHLIILKIAAYLINASS